METDCGTCCAMYRHRNVFVHYLGRKSDNIRGLISGIMIDQLEDKYLCPNQSINMGIDCIHTYQMSCYRLVLAIVSGLSRSKGKHLPKSQVNEYYLRCTNPTRGREVVVNSYTSGHTSINRWLSCVVAYFSFNTKARKWK